MSEPRMHKTINTVVVVVDDLPHDRGHDSDINFEGPTP